MSAETIGMISGFLVVVSCIPYSIRVHQRKITPNLVTWSLWTLLGFTLLITYKSSGAEANIWPAIFGFTNPLIITILAFWRNGMRKRLDRVEIFSLVFCLLAIGLWLDVRQKKELAQFSLYLAIIADSCAGIPTLELALKTPEKDRPFAWTLFAIGYGLVVFAITDRTFANYFLPSYMCSSGLFVAFLFARYRWRQKLPWIEWI